MDRVLPLVNCLHSTSIIVRFTNYLVAMVNKSVLPLRYNVPFMGEYAFLSTGLKFNLELILFKSPWVSFEILTTI